MDIAARYDDVGRISVHEAEVGDPALLDPAGRRTEAEPRHPDSLLVHLSSHDLSMTPEAKASICSTR